ncbi:MAG: DNA-3-methyladenine glycosylase 2 family protein [Proteobacteria bacterium]|nr:DNA-3-methyladenine glycosylase 2 family protein [Pseudomonadota bacterium]
MNAVPPRDLSLRKPLAWLAETDADIARAYEQVGLPPKRSHDPSFAGLLRILVAQQISVAAARNITARLEAAASPLTPETFLALGDADVRAIGLSGQKVRYGRALANAIADGALDLAGLEGTDDESAISALVAITGIGRWTAEIYLLFALRRPDVWPAGDLAIRGALQRLRGHAARPSITEARDDAESWRPHRSAAARFLWHYYNHPGVPDTSA